MAVLPFIGVLTDPDVQGPFRPQTGTGVYGAERIKTWVGASDWFFCI